MVSSREIDSSDRSVKFVRMFIKSTQSRRLAESPDSNVGSRAPSDRLALLAELSGGNLLADAGELLWLCDNLCRDTAPEEAVPGDGPVGGERT